VFPDNQEDGWFSNQFFINVDAEGRPFIKSKLTKEMEGVETDYEVLTTMLTRLASYLTSPEAVAQLACYHNWVMADEPCIFGCCQPPVK